MSTPVVYLSRANIDITLSDTLHNMDIFAVREGGKFPYPML
jgi:hypothetical protein